MTEQAGPDDPVQEEILSLVRSGQKIQAIKRLREQTGLGLKESKEQVEALERTLAASDPNFQQQLAQRKSGCAGVIVFGLMAALLGASCV